MNSIDTSLCCHINDYVYIPLTYTRTLSIAHAFMYDHIYIHIYREVYPIYFIVGGEWVRGITHICTCIALLQLYYPFALALTLFALALPIICTCITLLHLNYPFALALPIICICITHLHLNYPFAFELPIRTCVTHLHLHYPFVIFLHNPLPFNCRHQ